MNSSSCWELFVSERFNVAADLEQLFRFSGKDGREERVEVEEDKINSLQTRDELV